MLSFIFLGIGCWALVISIVVGISLGWARQQRISAYKNGYNAGYDARFIDERSLQHEKEKDKQDLLWVMLADIECSMAWLYYFIRGASEDEWEIPGQIPALPKSRRAFVALYAEWRGMDLALTLLRRQLEDNRLEETDLHAHQVWLNEAWDRARMLESHVHHQQWQLQRRLNKISERYTHLIASYRLLTIRNKSYKVFSGMLHVTELLLDQWQLEDAEGMALALETQLSRLEKSFLADYQNLSEEDKIVNSILSYPPMSIQSL